MRDYDTVVAFSNEGEEYGREPYRLQAEGRPGARKAALKLSEDSRYDDPRIPGRTRKVVSCRRATS